MTSPRRLLCFTISSSKLLVSKTDGGERKGRGMACAALAWLISACGPSPGSGLEATSPQSVSGKRVEDRPPIIDPKTSGPVSLAQLLAYADARAPSLSVARQRTKIGDAEVEGAETLVPYNPEVSVTAGGRTAGGVTRFEFGAELEQRLEIAGERGARIEAAERSRDARTAAMEVARWELHVTVHALYYKLLVRKRQLAAAAKLEVFTQTVRTVINKRVEAGEDSPLQTIVAKAELAKAAQVVIAAKQAHRETTLRLAAVSGWPASVKLEIRGKLGEAEPIVDGDSLTRRALKEHPSKRWLVAEVQAARARIEREDLEATPEPSIGVSYGREAEPGSVAHVWTGTLRMPIPIWQRNQVGRARARADLGVAKANQLAFERAISARIERAITRVNASAERVRVFGTDLLPAFEGNLDKLQRAFELGEVDILQLAQIQERILVTQRAALVALEDYYDALAALEGLTGVDLLSKGAKR